MNHLFLGQIIHTKSFSDFELFTNGFLAIENGQISAIGARVNLPNNLAKTLPTTQLSNEQFLLPGFVDCHIHAPQYPNIGLGLDIPLLEWLNTYTFPMESQFSDNEFSRNVYEAVVKRTLTCGTTLASYFATNHKNGSLILAEVAAKQGQRALVGKVSSNCSSPDYYVENTENSIKDNLEFIERVLQLNNSLVRPIVTPRFAISCDGNLMKELGKIAADHDLHIQSHISESINEIEFVKTLFPGENYATVYEKAGLLTNKCVMAHGVHLEDAELELFRKYGTSIAHCPTSNTNLHSGLCDVQRLLKAQIKVGLGTDVSGGNSASILTAIKDAIDVSHHLNFFKKQFIVGTGKISNPNDKQNSEYEPINYKNALYLATLGGAEALALDQVTGNFAVGKDFDALLVDLSKKPIDNFGITNENETPIDRLENLVQRFVYVGDDRNIVKVFVAGKLVKEI